MSREVAQLIGKKLDVILSLADDELVVEGAARGETNLSEHSPFQAFGVVDPAIATAATGLDFLKSMLERREPSPPFSETTDIWIVSAEMGRVVFEGMPSARFCNPMGVIHGGWLATPLDSCMECVVHSTLKVAQTYTTIEMKTVDMGSVLCGGAESAH